MAAHHAAADSTAAVFLSVLHPKFSIVSVGKDNPYDYPAADALGVLKKYSGTVLRTDRDGEMCFVLDAKLVIPCKVLPDESLLDVG